MGRLEEEFLLGAIHKRAKAFFHAKSELALVGALATILWLDVLEEIKPPAAVQERRSVFPWMAAEPWAQVDMA